MAIVLGCLGFASTVGAADLTGSFYAEGDPYPDLGVGGGGVVTLLTEDWMLRNTTTFRVWPKIRDSQVLEMERSVGDLDLLTTAAFSFTAVTFEPLDVALSGDVWTVPLPADGPQVEIACTAGVGVTMASVVEPYEFVDTTATIGDHYVTHSVVLHANPVGVESYVDALAFLFRTTIGDGDSAIAVSLTAFAETYVVPLEFSYATLKAKAGLGGATLTGIVTYTGGTEFTVALRLGMAFGPIAIDE